MQILPQQIIIFGTSGIGIAPYQMGGIYWNLYPFPVDNHNFSVIISNHNTKEQMSQTFTFLNDTFKWDGNIVESPHKWGTCP